MRHEMVKPKYCFHDMVNLSIEGLGLIDGKCFVVFVPQNLQDVNSGVYVKASSSMYSFLLF